MKINEMSKEELESLSYDDIAYYLLEESGTKTKITDLFQEVCNLLGLSQSEYEAKIADFFQMLSTDQRFIMLEKGFWDLKSRHQSKVVIEEDEEEDIDPEEIEEDEEENMDEEDIFYEGEETDDEPDDDLKDLVIVTDDNDEENVSI